MREQVGVWAGVTTSELPGARLRGDDAPRGRGLRPAARCRPDADRERSDAVNDAEWALAEAVAPRDDATLRQLALDERVWTGRIEIVAESLGEAVRIATAGLAWDRIEALYKAEATAQGDEPEGTA